MFTFHMSGAGDANVKSEMFMNQRKSRDGTESAKCKLQSFLLVLTIIILSTRISNGRGSGVATFFAKLVLALALAPVVPFTKTCIEQNLHRGGHEKGKASVGSSSGSGKENTSFLATFIIAFNCVLTVTK